MSFIEGIGDDFLYAFGFLLFLGIVSLAWFSTYVNQIHFPTTLFIIERRTRRRTEEESDQTSSTPPSRVTPPVSSPSGNETQAEHETDDNDSVELEEESIPTVSSVQEQSQCESAPLSSTTSEESMRITIKFLNETRKEILVNPNDTISKVKELHFAEELENNKMIRFIYQGRELQDRETVRTYNIHDQTIIHCQISARRVEPNHPPRNDGTSSTSHRNQNAFDPSTFIDTSPVNVSTHFVLLLSLILGFIWYLRIKYRLLFSPISTVILILITILFLIFTCGSLLSARRPAVAANPHHHQTTVAITPIQHVHLD